MYDRHIETYSVSNNRYDDFETFDCFKDINDRIKNNLAFSGLVIVLATTVYGVIIKRKQTYDFHTIKFHDNHGFHRCKLWYSRVSLNHTNLLSFRSRKEVTEKTSDYILCIPLYSDNTETQIEYTIISKNWKCRCSNNHLLTFTPSVPSLCEMIDSI